MKRKQVIKLLHVALLSMKWEDISYYLLKTLEIELAYNYHDSQLPLFQLHAEKRENSQEKENNS